MYYQILISCILFGQLRYLNANFIEKDLSTTPLLYYQENEIEFETSETVFSYRIDLFPINKLKLEYPKMEAICPSSHFLSHLHRNLFNSDMIWNHIQNNKIPDRNFIDLEPFNMQALKSDYFNYKTENSTDSKCKFLSSMTEQLHMFNNELNRINMYQFTTFSNIVSTEKLLADTYNFTSNSNLTNPLDFNHWFTANFYKYTEIDVKFVKNFAYITIRVPLFAHTTLSRIYPKPIFYNNVPYISNTQAEFMIDGQLGSNYFSNLNENCFYAINKTFCRKPKVQNNCDDFYIAQSTQTFHKDCFSRLQLRNTITRIKNDIYFLIFSPISINVSCNGSLQTIDISQSSKILNSNCFVNSTFFEFDPNSTLDYGVYFANSTENLLEWNLFRNPETRTIIQFYLFLVFLILYLFILSIIIYFHHEISSNNPSPQFLESQV